MLKLAQRRFELLLLQIDDQLRCGSFSVGAQDCAIKDIEWNYDRLHRHAIQHPEIVERLIFRRIRSCYYDVCSVCSQWNDTVLARVASTNLGEQPPVDRTFVELRLKRQAKRFGERIRQ